MYVVEPIKAPPFEFQTPDGAVPTIPAFSALPTQRIERIARRLAEADDGAPRVFDPMAEEALAIFEEYAPGVTETLAVVQLIGLARAYYGVAAPDGATAGESSGSSEST